MSEIPPDKWQMAINKIHLERIACYTETKLFEINMLFLI